MIHARHTKSGLRYDVRVGERSPKRTFTRKRDAEEYEAELIRSRNRGRAGLVAAKPSITFRDLVVIWESAYKPSAWRRSMIFYAVVRWGPTLVHMIQPEQIGAWINTQPGKNGQPLAEKTRAHILESMRQVLNAGVEWGYLDKSPARPRAFKSPRKNSRVSPIQPFESWDDVLRVADACAALNPVTGPFVRFACATGLRVPGEVLPLTWNDVTGLPSYVRIGSKTAAGHRTVPLSKTAISALADIPRAIHNDRIFQFDYHNWRRTDWRLALETCGLARRTPYEMRHTFATLALAHGASIDDVATVMGHDDISVAYRYYRKWIKTMADRLVNTLDQIGAEDARPTTAQDASHSG